MGFGISRSKHLTVYMGRYVQETVLVNALGTVKCVFYWKLFDFSDVYFCVEIVKIVFLDEVNLVLLLLFFRWGFATFLFRILLCLVN
jgi:hypothetical protein